MGLRDSSEEQRRTSGICRIGEGFAAVDEERLKLVMNTERGKEEEKDGLRSFPLAAGEAEPQSASVKAALAALRIYKVYLSAHMPGGCRFDPTCSMYAYQAIERFGVMRGTWLGLKRLMRCHPLSRKFGYDPVPEKMNAETTKTGEAERDAGQRGAAPREAHS